MSATTPAKTEGGAGETIRVVIHAIIIALVIRTFLFQPYTIPSGSEEPNLYRGDYIIVSKWSYGFSHHSILGSPPLFKGRLFFHAPTRGDIVVFKLPRDGHTDYIKRLVGLPGDRIQGAIRALEEIENLDLYLVGEIFECVAKIPSGCVMPLPKTGGQDQYLFHGLF